MPVLFAPEAVEFQWCSMYIWLILLGSFHSHLSNKNTVLITWRKSLGVALESAVVLILTVPYNRFLKLGLLLVQFFS